MPIIQSRNNVPTAVISKEVPQPARFEKKKNKAMLPSGPATTRQKRG